MDWEAFTALKHDPTQSVSDSSLLKLVMDNSDSVDRIREVGQYLLDSSNPKTLEFLCNQLKDDYKQLACFELAMIGIKFSKDLLMSELGWSNIFEEQLSIVAFYVPGKADIGFKYCDYLLHDPTLPKLIGEAIVNNVHFYIQKLEYDKLTAIEPELPAANDLTGEKHNPTNPSITKHDGKYWCVCRAVNYEKGRKLNQFRSMDAHGISITKNYLLELTPELDIDHQYEIVYDPGKVPNKRVMWYGIEDLRLFRYKDRWWALAISAQFNWFGVPQVVLCKFQASPKSSNEWEVETFYPLRGENYVEPPRTEKNWTPCVVADELYITYSYGPKIIYKFSETSEPFENLHKFFEETTEINLSYHKGSSQQIAFDDGYLTVTHQHAHNDGCRFYYHRWLYLDSDFNVRKLSLPFYFLDKHIEFACGLTESLDGEHMIVSFGVMDKQAQLLEIPKSKIRGMLFDSYSYEF